METRSRRSLKRVDYRTLADVRVPKRVRVLKPSNTTDSPAVLYRVQVLESDTSNELLKVRYIGYDSTYDEWRLATDIIDLTEDSSTDNPADNDASVNSADGTGRPDSEARVHQELHSPSVKIFSLYEELRYRIKSLLVSTRKGDPNCCVSMPFDTVHFDGLIRRGVLDKQQCSKKQGIYTLSTLTKLDDILGEWWYVKGLNTAGDFCYVQPNTVRYQLRFCSGKPDYQLLHDGTLKQYKYGVRYQLVFRFVRNDAISSQWSNILKLCRN